MKKTHLSSLILGIGCLALAPSLQAQTAIAHWTFDSGSLTIDGGSGNILGAADQTGNHNAVVGTGVGSASVANGGPTFTSNPIPGANSIGGQFGQGLTLSGFNNFAGGGGQFLMYPELTELMQANGAPSYTVSYWVNTTTTANQQFTVMSDWGNSATTPGRFVYGFGVNFVSGVGGMRGQTRNNNATAGGQDIYARAVSNPTTSVINNGAWHMLTWTFDTTSGVLKSYFDGILVETFQSTATAGFQMTDASSAFGTFGLKGDSGNFVNGSISLDEVWVFNGVLDLDTIQNLYANNVIPEPSSFALLGFGVLALSFYRRRRA